MSLCHSGLNNVGIGKQMTIAFGQKICNSSPSPPCGLCSPVAGQDPGAMPRPTSQDLAGFWDLLQLSIDDVTAKFDELQQIKSNQWQPVESPEKKVRPWPPALVPSVSRLISVV